MRRRLAWSLAMGWIAIACARDGGRGSGFDPQDASVSPDADPALVAADHALAVVQVIDANAIEQAILARHRSDDPEVLAIAEQQIQAFSAVGDRVRALLSRRRDLVPTDSAWTIALEQEAWTHRQQLASLEGGAFDRAWLAARAAEHESALALIERELLPRAMDDAVRPIVTDLEAALRATAPR